MTQANAPVRPAAAIRAADAGDPESWWDRRPFDRILLDAPCSASGVVRRHPYIKWLRRERYLAGFAREQARLLDALWRVLAPDGKLLYATCSVLAEENEAVVEAFLARCPGAALFIDFGRSQSVARASLRAVSGHHRADPFASCHQRYAI